jgi:hypothetical protein
MSAWENKFRGFRRETLRLVTIALAAVALLAFVVPVTPSFAQAAGEVRLKIAKAGVLVGAGGGTGVLTFRGRDYPFRAYGAGFGVTAGASVGEFEGWATGIREVRDFAGTYSSVGAGGALVAGFGGVHLNNKKGVAIELHGTTAGMEFAANVSKIRIYVK